MSKTYLNNTIPNNEIEIEGYSSDIFRSDHPTNMKRGGVCLYYKDTLPILCADLHILDESIVVKLTLSRKKLFFVVIYRSPSQSSDEFNLFLSRLELVVEHMRLEKPDCIILTGDFNRKTKQWWPDGEETNEGVLLNQLIESFSMTQLIDLPTHILANSSSLIDLIITDQVDLFVDSGLLPSSSCDKSHHEIIYGKLNLAAPLPPPYKLRAWDYNEANHNLIKESLSNTNWEAIFENSTSDEAVKDFTNIILSTMSQFIPNKIITINECDPPWLTKSIKNKIK